MCMGWITNDVIHGVVTGVLVWNDPILMSRKSRFPFDEMSCVNLVKF